MLNDTAAEHNPLEAPEEVLSDESGRECKERF